MLVQWYSHFSCERLIVEFVGGNIYIVPQRNKKENHI
jgi:hypothetical protein